jgi:TolA-binding protein
MTNTLKEMGSNDQSASLAIRLAHLKAFYKNETDTALVLLESFIQPNAGLSLRPLNEVKLEIADIQLLQGDVWESTLTYSQVEKAMKNDTLGQEAKFRNAKLAYYKGEFEWSKAQLDVLKAATTKLIANDALELSLLIGDNTAFDTTGEALRMFSRADLWLYQNKAAAALATLDSLNAAFPENTLADDILYRKAKVVIKQGKFTEAVTYLDAILTKYRSDILADNALFMLATITEQQLNNPTKAMDLYKELMTDFPGSLYVVEARKRFRTLRGDAVQ